MTPSKAQSGAGPKIPREVTKAGEFAIPIAVLAIVVALITPVPGFILDFLIVIDIMLSVIVMMVAMYIRRPAEFSVFPTTLLLMTLFRLALNVSSSRLILLDGNKGTSAAGHVIEAFGNFVVGGNYIIGAVIFCLLIAIQYVVINHGAVRISEVTARFTLDALPGKQMSIDADLNGGLIDETEARRRRTELASEAEFYGAMDGASRFTQRDAVAAILITSLNILAGFLIGVFQHGLDLRRALETYTILTIGDGLVTVIPALMISISGGLIITRASSDERLGTDVQNQLFGNYKPLALASGVLLALSAFPGLPALPFMAVSGVLAFVVWRARRKIDAEDESSAAAADAKPASEDLESLLHVDPLAIEVGLGLVSLIESGPHSPLLQRVTAIRRQLATQLGYIVPPVKVNDNLSLRSREYVVLLKGAEIARFELPKGQELAIPGPHAEEGIPGKETKEPAFGLQAWWVKSEQADAVRAKGYTVVDSVSIMGTHFTELVRRYAHEMFTRQDAKQYCDRVAQQNPRLIEDLVPKLLPLAVVQRVLQNLLRERVSIRDAATILEALGEAAVMTKNPVLLTEYVRQSVRRNLVKPFVGAGNEISAYFFDPQIEHMVESALEHGENNSVLALKPELANNIATLVRRKADRVGSGAVAITSVGARPFLRQILETVVPNLTILSHNEVPAEVRVKTLGAIG
jgi:flagellar biosynthesis protein FlhA